MELASSENTEWRNNGSGRGEEMPLRCVALRGGWLWELRESEQPSSLLVGGVPVVLGSAPTTTTDN